MNQDFRTLWKSSESFLKFETFGTFSTPELFESFQNQNLEEEFTDIYKLSHESCSENKTLFSHKINLIAEYHSSLNQSLSKHAPRKLFIYLSSRQSEIGSPTGGAISFKAVDSPPSYLTWNGRCSEHLFTFRPRFTAPREQARNKLHELTTLARYTQPACNEAS